MAYPTLDTLPDLSLSSRTAAKSLAFSTMGANVASWDVVASVFRSDDFASLTDTYKITLSAGTQYSFFTTSYFAPYSLTVYDEDGNAVVAAYPANAASSTATIFNYTAPYSGSYYVDAGWHQGSFYTTVSLNIYGDTKLPGLAGNDYLTGTVVNAGLGNDQVEGTSGSDYLRGDEGDDIINGGDGFDDINGNMGNDTCSGGLGDDWVVGGKDNDYLRGEQGNDIVLGNLGNDTQEGGAGNDIVRGGQDNDSISGGSGNDYVSGDKGDDTVIGGDGADEFHTFGEAGLDRVLDFSLSQGDKVRIDPGTTFTVAQAGADVDISMSGGGHMILVGVQLSSLTSGWIFIG